MDRLAMVYRLRPGAKEEYVRAHREMGPEMRDFLRRAGIDRMSIFLRGNSLFLYAEIEDMERYDALASVDPVSIEWEKGMAKLLDQPYDEQEPGIFCRIEEIWRFSSQPEES